MWRMSSPCRGPPFCRPDRERSAHDPFDLRFRGARFVAGGLLPPDSPVPLGRIRPSSALGNRIRHCVRCPDVYPPSRRVYTLLVTKRLIDVDDDALDAARARLGTRTIKDTVNEALRSAADQRSTQLASALSVLADADLDDRSAAWR